MIIRMPIRETGPERDSYQLFGNKHRAAVWRAVTRFAIEPPETFTYAALSEIAQTFETMGSSSIHKEVKLLETFGMVQREGEYHGDAIVFTRVASPFWQVAEATAAAFDTLYPVDTEQ